MKTLNCLLLILFIFTGCESNVQYPWILETSYEDILDSSDDKLLLLDFETEWWSWCDRLDADTYSNNLVISFALNNLVSFKIDAEKDYGVELVKKYNVSSYPTIVFLDDKGGEIDRIVGYLPPDKFLKELKRIHDGSNTLPALLLDLQLNPTKFSTLFRLIKKYENMNEKELAKEMIDTILSADTDSAGTAAFLSLLYDAREAQNPEPLIKYADQNPDNKNTEKVLQEAIAILRRKGNNPELEA